MKHTFKLIAVLLLALLLVSTASAQINWLKENGGTKYLAWDNGTLSKTIKIGQSATFTTGYFGSNLGQVHLTVTVNKKSDGTIVSTVVSKNVNANSYLGYETININPQHYGNKVGEYIIVVKLQDANQQKVDTSLLLKVNNIFGFHVPIPIFPLHDAPEMNAISDQQVFENQELFFQMSATDDGTITKYEGQYCVVNINNICSVVSPLSQLGAVLTTEPGQNQKVGKFTWTPGYDFIKYPVLAKNVRLRFRAVDNYNVVSEWEYVNVLVKNVNRAPYFNPALPDNTVIMEGQAYELEAHGFDADGDDLVFQLFNKPSGAVFTNNGNGETTFSWQPNSNQAGTYVLHFTVTDSFNAQSSETVTITVLNVNHAPILAPIGAKTVTEGDLLSFGVTATDTDNDPLQFIAGPLPQGAVFNPSTQQFSWTPDFDQAGSYQLTFKVSDLPAGLDDQETITITVLNKTTDDDPECDDNIDNDGDGKIDYPNDPGCDNPDDDDETDEDNPQCSDGIDNDGDEQIDYPQDPGCDNSEDDDETDNEYPQCSDGIDNDGDEQIDYPQDPGCDNPDDDDETDPVIPQCRDGLDNDGDTKIDFPADPGCDNSEDDNEVDTPKPQCDDGIDNDGDGKIDYPNDPGCSNKNDNDEFNPEAPEASFAHTSIKFKSALIDDVVYAGNTMSVHVNIFNNGDTDLKDLKIQASIYEVGVFGSTSDFTLSNGKGANKSVYVYIPEDVQPGWYLVKITAKNSHYHASTYRIAYIDSNTFQ